MKEQDSIEQELSATLNRTSSDLNSFKKSLNFRLNLAKSKEEILLREHFRHFNAAEMDLPAEVANLKEMIELKDQEIESLKQQVELNPIAAERHARVL